MADPIRLLTSWTGFHGRREASFNNAGQVIRRDPLEQSVRMIARYELRTWFEPKWGNAQYLARRFPHCMICSIPVESDTINLRRVPGWRPRRDNGVV